MASWLPRSASAFGPSLPSALLLLLLLLLSLLLLVLLQSAPGVSREVTTIVARGGAEKFLVWFFNRRAGQD